MIRILTISFQIWGQANNETSSSSSSSVKIRRIMELALPLPFVTHHSSPITHHPSLFTKAIGENMSDMKKKFEKAQEDVTRLAERPDNQMLLKLYALYKQAMDGDVSGDRPGGFDLVGAAK